MGSNAIPVLSSFTSPATSWPVAPELHLPATLFPSRLSAHTAEPGFPMTSVSSCPRHPPPKREWQTPTLSTIVSRLRRYQPGRRAILPTNSAPFRPRNPTSGEAFVTMGRWLDHARCGPTFLRQPAMAQLVPTSIQYGAEIGHYELHSWVIMPHRVHLLLTPQASLSKLPGSLQAAAAKRANLPLQRSGQPFWQDESYDRLVRDGDEFRRIQRYIEGHPVSALLAARPERYAWSSAGRAACEAGAGPGPAPPM